MAATLMCCLSCVETNTGLGTDLLPLSQQYDFYTEEFPIEDIELVVADGLSGYSQTRITVGAIRDDIYGLTTRKAAFTLVPMFVDSLEIGQNPIFKDFHFSAAIDTVSVNDETQGSILQTLKVYELAAPIDTKKSYDCNATIEHMGESISSRALIYNGVDSLSFNFKKEFGEKFLALKKEDFKDMDSYLKKFPGIVIEAENPTANGGRINLFKLQLGYDANYESITGNIASLRYSAEFKGERKDTAILFYFGATDFHDIDSLLTNSGTGSFPQYALNMTSHEQKIKPGVAEEKIYIEGGGGLKPRISAEYLKELTEQAIIKKGGNPKTSVINKASIIMPFEFPENYKDLDIWPQVLSPTCRILAENEDEFTSFVGLTDASSSDENQGNINRSICVYEPDITYHLQSLIRIDKSKTEELKTKRLLNGSYDIWFLIMANEITTTTSSGSDDMSEYYQYLAYQSYYNSMYGGYGYGSYGGYGGYDNYYSNYYSYAMMAAYANQSNTTVSTAMQLDKDRYYSSALNGPKDPSGKVPTIRITFGIPKE